MKKTLKNVIVFTIIISLFANLSIPISGLSTKSSTKLYSSAKITDNFADDTLLIIFNNEASLLCKEYTSYDFNDIEVDEVKHISNVVDNKVKSVLNNITQSASKSSVSSAVDDYNLSTYHQVISLKLKNPGKDNVLKAMKLLEEREDIMYVSPSYYWTLLSDSNYEDTNTYNFASQWAAEAIQLQEAWNAISNIDLPTTRVGVIDSGIMGNHSDLQNNIDDSAYDFEPNGDIDPHDDILGHGTRVAGVIAGVAPNVSLISLKVTNSETVSAEYVYDAIYKAIELNLDVINLSLAWPGNEVNGYGEYDPILEEAIERYNGLIVCGAGNNNSLIDDNDLLNYNIYPQQLEYENLLVVGASRQMVTNTQQIIEVKAPLSNYGQVSVDVFAPGYEITTTSRNGNYISTAGNTSMATAFVTGIVTLLLSINSNWQTQQLKTTIMSTVDICDDEDPTVESDDTIYDMCFSHGRVNAYKAVQAAIDYNTTPCNHSNATYTYTADTHTFTCPDCSYTFTEPHNDFTYTSNNANTHTRRCSDCPHTLIEAHNDFSYTYNAYTHSLKCSDCPYITGNAVHTGSYVTYDANTHTYSCSVCSYTLSSAHELYVYSDNGEDGVTIKCNTCNYMRTCYVGVAEYGYGGDNGHYVDCTCGCYSFFTAHIPQFIMQTSSLYTHNVHCRDCNTIYSAPHSWIPSGLGYECVMCGMSALTIPDIMQIPSGDEILIASGDENGTAIALLPEKEDDLVTE